MSWDDGIKNARIDSTKLGTEDHGLFTFSLGLDYGGSFQHFGGIGLDNPPKDKTKLPFKRQPTAYGMDCIVRILETVGVESWEDLKNKYVRAEVKNGYIVGLINILDDDKVFYPKKLYEEEYKELTEIIDR